MMTFPEGPENPFCPPQDLAIPIWRYMTLSRLESLLTERGLWFSRLDVMQVDDPFEGSLPAPDYEAMRAQYNETVMAASKTFTEIFSLKRVMVNCWHMNHHESVAMWRHYGQESKSVCVQATFNRLYTVLSSTRKAGVGVVNYIDYVREPLSHEHPFWSRFMHKRKSFEYEHELRAVMLNDMGAIPDIGIMLPVDLSRLIERIYVAPNAGTEVEAEVRDLIENASFSFPVCRSSLDDRPIF